MHGNDLARQILAIFSAGGFLSPLNYPTCIADLLGPLIETSEPQLLRVLKYDV